MGTVVPVFIFTIQNSKCNARLNHQELYPSPSHAPFSQSRLERFNKKNKIILLQPNVSDVFYTNIYRTNMNKILNQPNQVSSLEKKSWRTNIYTVVPASAYGAESYGVSHHGHQTLSSRHRGIQQLSARQEPVNRLW